MSITSGPINEGERAAEKLVSKLEADTPATLAAALAAVLVLLKQHELVIRISLDQK